MAKDSKRRIRWFVPALIIAIALVQVFGLTRLDYTSAADYEQILWSVVILVFAVVAGLILSRERKNLIGWLLIMPPLMATIQVILDYFFLEEVQAATTLTTSTFLYLWFGGWSWWLLIGPILLILILFPTGRLISKNWRWAVATLGAGFVLFLFIVTFSAEAEDLEGTQTWPSPIGFLTNEAVEGLVGVMSIFLVISTILAFVSVFVRYRRAQAAERAQLRWLFFAAGLFALVYVPGFFIDVAGSEFGFLFVVAVLAIPLAIGIAILRYRLWDIDLVINRSLVYGILTALLAGIFAATASLAAQIAKIYFGGEMNEAAAAVAAIFVASIFQPLRLWVEGIINRRLFPENIDLSQGLVEIDPDVWHWVDLQTILNATLHHLKGIYSFTNAGIYQLKSENEFRSVAALGSTLQELSVLKLTKPEMELLAAKKGVVDDDGNPYAVLIPIYLARRNSSEVLGLLRLGKREKGRGYSGDDIKTLVSFGAKLGKAVFALSSDTKSKR